MVLCAPNPVDCFGISHGLSTRLAGLPKLFITTQVQTAGLQTMFGRPQDVELTVENRLVHRTGLGLSTITIDL